LPKKQDFSANIKKYIRLREEQPAQAKLLLKSIEKNKFQANRNNKLENS
jgi:gamma-glutamyl:cysteine ligase YbdK (ATP-grasp superfamily)